MKSKLFFLSWVVFVSFFILLNFFIFKFDFLGFGIRGVDGYYHINISRLILAKGIHYNFKWIKFSTLGKVFADRSFLFHLLSAFILQAFSNLGHTSLVFEARIVTFFYQLIFLLSLAFVLRRFVPLFLIPIFLLLPFTSTYFLYYFSYLRPATFAYLFLFAGLFFLINKKYLGVFVTALVYPFAHMSFPLLLIFALLVETVRYIEKREFFVRNIYAVVLGSSLGCFFHPDFPANILSFYLNVILMPLEMLKGGIVTNGRELNSLASRYIVFYSLFMIISLVLVLVHSFFWNRKKSFSAKVLLIIFMFFFLLSLISQRFLYQANVFCLIFLSAYFRDYLQSFNLREKSLRVRVILAAIFLFFLLSFRMNYHSVKSWLLFHQSYSRHFKRVAGWLKRKVPPGTLLFHTGFSDAEFLITLAPQYYYLNISDNVYMYYWNKDIYTIYSQLQLAKFNNPAYVIKNVFATNYGYASKDFPFYYQVKRDKKHFDKLVDEPLGILFKIKDIQEPLKQSNSQN